MRLKTIYQCVDCDGEDDGTCAYYRCPGCGLRGPINGGASFRGAAIRAGRAMRLICERVEARFKKDAVVGVDDLIWAQGNRAAISEMQRTIDRLKESMNRIEGHYDPT
ncbi:MAG: hypothetical protein EOM20_19525 [Spartobacteria bacterium]|nr:hypothetical protein [Spartobacteria bacterium]